jgi:multisubunit Na+/H+ antiporter MnhB subunit
MRKAISIVMVAVIGVFLAFAVARDLDFGKFPERGLVGSESIGQHILENALGETGSTNVVTGVVWDYRAYDTLGEATVLFAAVCGVLMLFLALKGEKNG